jgi:hypothetical protein
MSSLFSHIFIPLIILLLFSKILGIDPKKVIILSPFAAFSDLDHIFFENRALLHSIFILLIPILLFILIKSRRDVSGIISFYLASHIILDIFNGGVMILYPFSNNFLYAHAELFFRDGNFRSVLDHGFAMTSRKMTSLAGWKTVISNENTATAAMLVICIEIFTFQRILKAMNINCRSR